MTTSFDPTDRNERARVRRLLDILDAADGVSPSPAPPSAVTAPEEASNVVEIAKRAAVETVARMQRNGFRQTKRSS